MAGKLVCSVVSFFGDAVPKVICVAIGCNMC
jgi:hypothetical protein